MVLVNEDLLFEATGRRVTLPVTSEFGFRGARICSFRHDYDLDDLLRQLRPEPGWLSPQRVTSRAGPSPAVAPIASRREDTPSFR